MITIQRYRIVAASPEKVFEALSDPNQLRQLLPRVQRIEILEQHADHARLATHMLIGNGLGTIRCEGDLQWVEPKQISFIVRKPLLVENAWTLEPVPKGTEVSVTMSLDLTPILGPFAKFVPTAAVTDMLSQDLETALSQLSRCVEEQRLQERATAA